MSSLPATIVRYRCPKCGVGYRSVATPAEAQLLGGRPRCPTHGCKGKMKSVTDEKGTDLAVAGSDLFIAVSGLGLPQERRLASTKLLKQLLEGKKIQKVSLTKATETRSIVESITLEDGKTIHFGVSTKGATVFKVTEKKNVGR